MSAAEVLAQLEPHRRTLTLPHITLNYWEWNSGGEPVLLLHGLADHGLVWARVAKHLSDRYHCVAPDLRGHGDSGKPAQGYRCEDIIADLHTLMDHLGWNSAHVVGHSWSAKVAAIWAKQQPQRIRSLVLIDPFFIGQMPGWLEVTFPFFYRVLPFLKMMGPFASREEAEQQARQLKQYRGWDDLQAAIFESAIEQKTDGRWGSKFAAAARDQIFQDVMQVAGLTEPLETPTLFIQPTAGLNRSNWQLQPYHTYLKNLQIQQVPGHHWCFLVEPEAFNSAIATFLDAQSSET